jgi:rfaE bifunctional protein kinase chain/domain
MKKINIASMKALNDIQKKTHRKTIVFVSGNFNVIHPGHLRLLRFAKECGNFLVVGVLDSHSQGAIVQEELRIDGIRAISWVDYGFILHDQPENFIEHLKPAIVVKGKEHEDQNNPEAEILKKTGGKLLFGSGDISFSSIDLIRKEFTEINVSTIKKPKDFPSRHHFAFHHLKQLLTQMNPLRICVLGDVIVDEYITCDPLGMSQEDPTIVVTPLLQEKFIGGAGVVAAHARGLGSKVHFFSVCGKDQIAEFVKNEMGKLKIDNHIYMDESRPTTLKQRFRAGQKTLLRVSHLRQHAIGKEIRKKMISDVFNIINEIDLLIFSDFNYGCLPQQLVDDVVAKCLKKHVMIVADSQSSSQIGDISRFHHASLVTPTEREVRLAVHDFESGLVVLAEKLRQKACTRNVIITLGSEGILIHAETNKKNKWLTDRLPAMNASPKDVAGAGDSFLTCASMALASGADIWKSSYLGSLAAACQVSRIGNIPLTTEELKMELGN